MSYSTTILADSPVGYWRLHETTGTSAVDSSGNGYDYTYSGSYTLNQSGPLTGETSRAVYFNDGYLTRATAAALHPGDSISIEAWVKRTTVTFGTQCFYDPAANEGVFKYNATDKLVIRKDSVADIFTTTASFTDTSDFHHVVFTKNGSAYHVYVDGADQAGTDAGNQTLVASTAAPIFFSDSSLTDYLYAHVSELALYDYALTSGQVAAHYAAATSSVPAWTTPADTVSMSSTPELKFNSPTSAVAQHFYLELDTANTFNTGNLRTYDSSTNQTNWHYWNGSTWTAMPSSGLPTGSSGNEVRYTVTSALSSATWYRRVRAGTLV
jgi:hypothetical protein